MSIDKNDSQKIAVAWIKLHSVPEDSPEREGLFWAYSRVCDLVQDDPEQGWQIIETIRRLDGSDLILSNLAAGPLEDLLVAHGEKFIDHIEALAKDDQQLRKLLGATWQNDMSDALWARIRAVAAPSW
ncbi:DUF6869 domain-containing protein [Xanthomonas albilineans]|uniref:DUF6869 domain-containing protein n=1 Tax=Xanthomonas albilineans TaxID=29447 RepID=UPI0006960312|nr:hypothetical protein [Xanthomonas albilineans]